MSSVILEPASRTVAAEPVEKASGTDADAVCAEEKQIMKTEWRVVAVVAAVFLGLELLFRWGGVYLSKDIAHLRSFPEIAASLAEMPAEQGERVLFLGNSLTRYGVDPEVFEQVCLEQGGEKIQALKMNPDNTAVADWFYGYRTFFARTGTLPDVLVIGFEGGHLRDAPSNHPERLAQYYCSWDDYEDLSRFDLKGFEEKMNWGLSHYSAAFGNRDRIQRRILDDLIPEYRAGMDELNRRMNRDKQKASSQEHHYERLRELIALAERDGVQVILAAMPVPEAYEFDPELLELVQNTSAELVDCRVVEGITLPMFFDGLHMDEEAQQLYSQDLAKRCVPLLKAFASGKTPKNDSSLSSMAGN